MTYTSAMPPDLFFVRHGESLANLSGIISNRVTDNTPLTEKGCWQAAQLPGKLNDQKVIAVYSSPLMRAKQTAEILAVNLKLPVETLDGLREPFCGEIEGRNDDQAWRLHAAQERAWANGDLDFRIPGGESLSEVFLRFSRDLNQIIEKHKNQSGALVLVSHGSLLTNTLPRFVNNISPAFAYSHPLQNCSLILARIAAAEYACLSWNDVSLLSMP